MVCSEQLVSTKLVPFDGHPNDQNKYFPFYKTKLYRTYGGIHILEDKFLKAKATML